MNYTAQYSILPLLPSSTSAFFPSPSTLLHTAQISTVVLMIQHDCVGLDSGQDPQGPGASLSVRGHW